MYPKMSIVLLIGWMTCIVGCSDLGDNSNPQTGQVEEEFQLLNSRGEASTTFSQADSIVFVYRLNNQTGRDLVIGMAHGGPFVQFIVCEDTVIVQDSFEGYVLPSSAPSFPFRSNQIVEERWTLAAGSFTQQAYIAVARPQMVVGGNGVPSEQSITFRVQ